MSFIIFLGKWNLDRKDEEFLKKVIGIISIVLFLIISLQSCVAGLGNALSENGEVSGSAGLILSVFMLIAGIISVISKSNRGMTIVSTVFYVLGGLMGIANVGSYADLQIWSILSLLFGVLLIFHMVKYKELYSTK